MKRDITVYLEDILGSIELIEEYTNNLNYEEFENNISIQDVNTSELGGQLLY